MNIYDFNTVNNIADIGSDIIEKWLKRSPSTVDIVNVEKNPYYQRKDVDFVWDYIHKTKGKLQKLIELKVDRYAHTGNFFFETISNAEKNTPGCFMYTESDYLFYYFITKEKEQLYILDMKEVRPWFIANKHRFKEKWLKTKVKADTYYSSCGNTVPIQVVVKECPSTRVITMPEDLQKLNKKVHNKKVAV